MSLGPRFTEALTLAAELHVNQRRKASATPYVAHLLAVTAIVLEHGGSEDEAIAALLHDAVEDQGGEVTRRQIERRFGAAVVAIVDGCTDTDCDPKPPWQARKEAHLARLPEASRSVQLVCAADKLHNVRTLLADYLQVGEALWSRFSGGRAGTLWYYRAVANLLDKLQGTPLIEELREAVTELDRLAAGGESTATRAAD